MLNEIRQESLIDCDNIKNRVKNTLITNNNNTTLLYAR